MNENRTDIVVILDRSGSMDQLRDETIIGFNTFVEKQKEIPDGKVSYLTLVQFNDKYQVDYTNKNVKDVPKLDYATYVPGHFTALHDAMGRTIVNKGQELADLPEHERPSRVIFFIITDGLENASKEYTGFKVKEMVEHQTNKYNWNFMYMGANQDAILVGSNLGIQACNSATYTVANIKSAFLRSGHKLANYANSGCKEDLHYNSQDREEFVK